MVGATYRDIAHADTGHFGDCFVFVDGVRGYWSCEESFLTEFVKNREVLMSGVDFENGPCYMCRGLSVRTLRQELQLASRFCDGTLLPLHYHITKHIWRAMSKVYMTSQTKVISVVALW